jgi:hypothetical protein
MSVRRIVVLGAVAAVAVVATLFLRSHGGPEEAPIPEAPPKLEPETAPPRSPDPSGGRPSTPTPPGTTANAPSPSPVPAEQRTDASAPNVRARAMHDALLGATSDEARLYADLRRTGRPVPPEAGLLVEMKRAGASAADLASYVRRSFPDDPVTRATALKWIRIHVPGELPAGADAGPATRTRIFRTTPGP